MKWSHALLTGTMALLFTSCSGENNSSFVGPGGAGTGGTTIPPTITGLGLPSTPKFVAIHKGELFWTDDDPVIGLKKAPLTGGRITPLAIVYSNAIQIIMREGVLYWNESFHLGRLFPGGRVEILVDGSACSHGEQYGTNMVVDDTYVYRLAGSPTLEHSSDACAITRTHLVNGTSTTIVDNPQGPIYSLIADSTHIYWAERTSTGSGDLYSIKKASKETGVIQTLASGLNGFGGNLAIAGSFLVFGEANGIGTARILKIPLAGGAPIILAGPASHAEIDGLRGLVVDAQNVYWIGDTTVQSVSLNGGARRILVTGNNPIVSIAANATDVFWIEHVCCAGDVPSRINRISKAGGSVSFVAQGMYAARDLTLDSTTLYWGEGRYYFLGRIAKAPLSGGQPTTVLSGVGRGTGGSLSPAFIIGETGIVLAGYEALKRIPLDGGPQVETLYWKLGSGIPYGAVTDNENVYFFAGNVTGHYDLLKIPMGGGDPVTLFSDPTRVSWPLAVGNGMVFWIKETFTTVPDSIMQTPSSGGPTVPLVTGLTGAVTDMLVDSDALYWVEEGSSAIRKIALTGGPVITLWPGAAREGFPKITHDESFIYWINQTQVGKVPKAGGQPAFYELLFDYRRAIGVDDTSVYWVTDYALWRATPK